MGRLDNRRCVIRGWGQRVGGRRRQKIHNTMGASPGPSEEIHVHGVRMTTDTPGCVLFLIDQSGSMQGCVPDGVTKALTVADALNRLLSGLVARCTDARGIHDVLHVGVLGYEEHVVPRLAGAGRRPSALVPISEIAFAG